MCAKSEKKKKTKFTRLQYYYVYVLFVYWRVGTRIMQYKCSVRIIIITLYGFVSQYAKRDDIIIITFYLLFVFLREISRNTCVCLKYLIIVTFIVVTMSLLIIRRECDVNKLIFTRNTFVLFLLLFFSPLILFQTSKIIVTFNAYCCSLLSFGSINSKYNIMICANKIYLETIIIIWYVVGQN